MVQKTVRFVQRCFNYNSGCLLFVNAPPNGELTSGGLVTAVFQKNEESVNSIFDQNATGLAV
jgi:hypothetical protein